MQCPSCLRPNGHQPVIIVGKVLAVLMACVAIWLAVYLSVHHDEYSGSKPEPLPGKEPVIHLHRSAEAEQSADAKFSGR
jgi:hypothetical protein